MPSIENIKGSDGTAETVRAVVTAQRAVSSTTIQVNSIVGYASTFIGMTGALDADDKLTVRPQVFFGHISGSDFEIDSFAPGYTDQGSEVGDVVIVKPTTAWADELASILEVSLNDDGTLKDEVVTSENLKSTVAFRATTTQSIANTTQADVTTYTEVFDLGSDFVHTTGIFTAPYDGVYSFTGGTGYTNVPDTGRVVCWIATNVTIVADARTVSGSASHDPSIVASTGPIYLTAGQTVKMQTLHDTGSAASLRSPSFFSGYLIGRA